MLSYMSGGGGRIFFPLIPRFICPLCPTRKSISTDGFPVVNLKHGGNQMTVKDRSSRQRTRRSGCFPEPLVSIFLVLSQYQHLVAVSRMSFLCDEAAALRDSPAWVFGLMLQWEDEETLLCRGRLSLLHTCVWLLEKPSVQQWKSTRLLSPLQAPDSINSSTFHPPFSCACVHLTTDLFERAHSFSHRHSALVRLPLSVPMDE